MVQRIGSPRRGRIGHSSLDFVSIIAILASLVVASFAECIRENACSCRDQQTSQLVSLYSLADLQGKPGLHVQNGNFVYEFNPCINITSPICQDVAFCQHFNNSAPGTFFSLGTQESVQFSGSVASNDIRMQLQGRTNGVTRYAIIDIICDESAATPVFDFVKESPLNTYMFNLSSKCACPGQCRPPPQQCTQGEFNKCSCQLSDGGALVNLQTIDDPSSPIVSPGATPLNISAYYNPCSGMTGGPADCHGSTVCLKFENRYLPIGKPDTERYTVDGNGNVVVTYGGPQSVEAVVTLVCDYSARHIPRLVITGQVPIPRLTMELRSICACPGACISPPLSCEAIDDCSCKVSEGGGTFSLRELDNPTAPLIYHRISSGSGQTFVYNPCSNFSIAGIGDDCRDVAGCQFDGYATPDYPNHAMGLQNTAQFRISQDGVLTLSYTGGQTGRHFVVELICNKTVTVPELTWLSESPQHYYHLQLESEYACENTKRSKP